MKTITIKDEVYHELKRLKREGESFSDVISRLIERRGFNLENYFGVLKTNRVLKEIERRAEELRRRSKLRYAAP